MATEALLLKEIVGRSSHSIDEIYEKISDLVGGASIVLFGEATHGTHEFYEMRAELTKRLLLEKNFSAVAVEADWPDAYRINRYVQGLGADESPFEALTDFERFPAWMWRNYVVHAFIGWLRAYNQRRAASERVGFYGIDLYSLSASVDAILRYLEGIDPEAARRARERYSCFEMFLEHPQSYGYASTLGIAADCEQEALQQLVELRRNATQYLKRAGLVAQDEQFSAEQNAVVIKNAETYYRAMFGDAPNSWNLRDTHMFETIKSLHAHFSKHRRDPKIIVWEHNSHIGDARATETSRRKELNVGQLVRQHFGERSRLIGFTTYSGSVTAASAWGGDSEMKKVRAGLPESYEALFHGLGIGQFMISFGLDFKVRKIMTEQRLERAIGVIYRPETERYSHYFMAHLPSQFDAVIHIDSTSALKPLRKEKPRMEELPETFPSGF